MPKIVFILIALIFKCIKSLIFYFPTSAPNFHNFNNIFNTKWDIGYKIKDNDIACFNICLLEMNKIHFDILIVAIKYQTVHKFITAVVFFIFSLKFLCFIIFVCFSKLDKWIPLIAFFNREQIMKS